MSSTSCAQALKFAAATALVAPSPSPDPARAADSTPSPCSEDAMIVFDASGSMAGQRESKASPPSNRASTRRGTRCRGPAARDTAIAAWVSSPTALALTTSATSAQIRACPERRRDASCEEVNSLTPAGRTPHHGQSRRRRTCFDHRKQPGSSFSSPTAGRPVAGRPATSASSSMRPRHELTVHVISYRYRELLLGRASRPFSIQSASLKRNNGFYITAYNYQELVDAFEKALDCPMIAGSSVSWGSGASETAWVANKWRKNRITLSVQPQVRPMEPKSKTS